MKENIRVDLNFFNNKIHDNELHLERAKVLNEQIQELNAKRLSAELLLQKIQEYLDDLVLLKSMSIAESKAFKKRRLQYLNQSITDELAKIFPEEHFTAQIETDFKYGSDKAQLVLIDQSGKKRIPYISEGKLCQYMLSFSSTVGTIKGLGKHNIYIDEAFGAASQNKLVELGNILGPVLDEGIQIILVSQHSELYENLPRREFRLQKDYSPDMALDENTGKVIPVASSRLNEVVDIL